MRQNDNNDWETEKLNPNGWNPQKRPSQAFNVVRPVYQQDTLNKDADYHPRHQTIRHKAKKLLKQCGFDQCIFNSLPIVKWLPRYNIKAYLLGDLVAGATTAVMHIPQGMAYALLAEVPPIVGLYMAFFPLLVYVCLGTSPHISMGTFAVACLMAGKVVTQLSYHEPSFNETTTFVPDTTTASIDAFHEGATRYAPLEVLSAVCITVGIFQILMWVFRMGMVSTLLSDPLVSGFTTAASFHVLASQVKDLLGIPLPKYSGHFKVILTIVQIIQRISLINWVAFGVSFIFCLVIALNNECLKPWVSKRSRVPVPIELLAIVTGTLICKYGGLNANYGIGLVGNIPTGLPIPKVPSIELIPVVALDAFTITMVTYTITMSMALIFASREKYEIDANQELLALGASNLFGSFFSCSPICASLSRSYIQYQAGAKTGITSVVSALLVLTVLLWIGPFFEDLPRCVLASIIVVSLKGMFMQVTHLRKFWRLSKLDAMVWLVTFLTTMIINIDIGLGLGLLASLGALFCRSQKPYTCLLGRMRETDIYLDINRYRAAEEIPGVKIFHYCGGLNFATKNLFRATLFRKVTAKRDSVRRRRDSLVTESLTVSGSEVLQWSDPLEQLNCVIIDATALSYVDAPGIKTLISVQKELLSHDITVLLAGANAPVLEMIDRYNSLETESLQLDVLPTVHDAVVYFKILHANKTNSGITIKNDK